MTPSDPSDAELLRRMRAHDEAAFGELLARHEATLFRFLLGILRDQHQAEDALQETFIQAIRQAHYADPERFRAWLFAVGYQQAMLLLRRERRQPDPAHDADAAWVDPAATPEQIAIAQDEQQTILALLARLPAPQQSVIRLRIQDGLKFREVAERLGVPLNTALGRMRDGLQRLRELWEKRGHD